MKYKGQERFGSLQWDAPPSLDAVEKVLQANLGKPIKTIGDLYVYAYGLRGSTGAKREQPETKDGLFQEMKRRQHYEKPSMKRKRKSAQARKKRRKALKRTLQYESDWIARPVAHTSRVAGGVERTLHVP